MLKIMNRGLFRIMRIIVYGLVVRWPVAGNSWFYINYLKILYRQSLLSAPGEIVCVVLKQYILAPHPCRWPAAILWGRPNARPNLPTHERVGAAQQRDVRERPPG